MTDHEKVFSILNPIIFGNSWEETTEPFQMDDLHKALEKAGAIKMVSIGVTIYDYVQNLVESKIVKHIGQGMYQKDADFCVNYFRN